MKVVIDVNLSVRWLSTLREAGIEAFHWRDLGPSTAPDTEIMAWARQNKCIIFTQDLDFGALLALTKAGSPSVFQIRVDNSLPRHVGSLVIEAFSQFEEQLTHGALVTLDGKRARAKILPFRQQPGSP